MGNLDDLLKLSEKVLEKNRGENNGFTYNTEIETQLTREKVEDLKQNRKERIKYAGYTYQFLCYFCFALLFIIILSGLNTSHRASGFYLSENVLITLITTSLTTVAGIFIFVMRYLFK